MEEMEEEKRKEIELARVYVGLNTRRLIGYSASTQSASVVRRRDVDGDSLIVVAVVVVVIVVVPVAVVAAARRRPIVCIRADCTAINGRGNHHDRRLAIRQTWPWIGIRLIRGIAWWCWHWRPRHRRQRGRGRRKLFGYGAACLRRSNDIGFTAAVLLKGLQRAGRDTRAEQAADEVRYQAERAPLTLRHIVGAEGINGGVHPRLQVLQL